MNYMLGLKKCTESCRLLKHNNLRIRVYKFVMYEKIEGTVNPNYK